MIRWTRQPRQLTFDGEIQEKDGRIPTATPSINSIAAARAHSGHPLGSPCRLAEKECVLGVLAVLKHHAAGGCCWWLVCLSRGSSGLRCLCHTFSRHSLSESQAAKLPSMASNVMVQRTTVRSLPAFAKVLAAAFCNTPLVKDRAEGKWKLNKCRQGWLPIHHLSCLNSQVLQKAVGLVCKI